MAMRRSLGTGGGHDDDDDDDYHVLERSKADQEAYAHAVSSTSPQRGTVVDLKRPRDTKWNAVAAGVKKVGVLNKVFNLKASNSKDLSLSEGDWAKQAVKNQKSMPPSVAGHDEFTKRSAQGKSISRGASFQREAPQISTHQLMDLQRQHEIRIEKLLERHQRHIMEALGSKSAKQHLLRSTMPDPELPAKKSEVPTIHLPTHKEDLRHNDISNLNTNDTSVSCTMAPIDFTGKSHGLGSQQTSIPGQIREPSEERLPVLRETANPEDNEKDTKRHSMDSAASVDSDQSDGDGDKSKDVDDRNRSASVGFALSDSVESAYGRAGQDSLIVALKQDMMSPNPKELEQAGLGGRALQKKATIQSIGKTASSTSTGDHRRGGVSQGQGMDRKSLARRMSHVVTKFNRIVDNAATKGLKDEMAHSIYLRESLEEKSQFQQMATRVMLFCRGIIRTKAFDLGVALLIISNAIVIGFQTQWAVGNENADLPSYFRGLEIFFTVSFTMELAFRIGATGKKFLFSDEWRWNVFDSLVVISAIAEEIVLSIIRANQDPGEGGNKQELSLLRALAILRLVRITRVIRVMQFSRDLRIMVYGIANSLRSLMWAVVLLLLVMFILAVIVTQVITDSIVDGSIDAEARYESKEGMQEGLGHYSSLLRSAFSLYKAISGGEDWGILAEPLMSISPALGLLFAMYIAFSVFCVLNVVTGVFVENTSKIKENDTDHMIMEELSERSRYLLEVRNLFDEIDGNEAGVIDWNIFENRSSDLRVQAYFRKIGLNVEAHNARRLFQLLDYDANGYIDAEDFVLGCAQLRGSAQKLDITSLRHDSHKISKSLQALTKSQDAFYRSIQQQQQMMETTGGSDPSVASEVVHSMNELIHVSDARWRKYEQYERQNQKRFQENERQLLQVLEPLSRLLGTKDDEKSLTVLPPPPPADASPSRANSGREGRHRNRTHSSDQREPSINSDGGSTPTARKRTFRARRPPSHQPPGNQPPLIQF